jgi:hypothetical protein
MLERTHPPYVCQSSVRQASGGANAGRRPAGQRMELPCRRSKYLRLPRISCRTPSPLAAPQPHSPDGHTVRIHTPASICFATRSSTFGSSTLQAIRIALFEFRLGLRFYPLSPPRNHCLCPVSPSLPCGHCAILLSWPTMGCHNPIPALVTTQPRQFGYGPSCLNLSFRSLTSSFTNKPVMARV